MIRTVSLETARLLKENGFKQGIEGERILYWVIYEGLPSELVGSFWSLSKGCKEKYYAPTSDELLNDLPWRINYEKECLYLTIKKGINDYGLGYRPELRPFNRIKFFNESLPEGLSQMWLWLKKEGLI